MLTFHPVCAQDAQWATPLLQKSEYMSSAHSFTNLFVWSHVYKTQLARFEDWVIARSESRRGLHYLWPAGKGNEIAAINAILDDAKGMNRPFIIYSISVEAKARLEQEFPGVFDIKADRNESDYIYEQAELAELPGKKFQKKRNHVSRFIRENPDWQFHPITPADIPAIRAFNLDWSQLYGNQDDAGIQQEHGAVELALTNYETLGLSGGFITASDKIVAFSFGSPLSEKVFDSHVEKALYDVNGAYNIINREMARNVCANFQLINREDDVGEEGLRTAKLSYHPAILEPKYVAVLKTQTPPWAEL